MLDEKKRLTILNNAHYCMLDDPGEEHSQSLRSIRLVVVDSIVAGGTH
jgi:hypothetical protein